MRIDRRPLHTYLATAALACALAFVNAAAAMEPIAETVAQVRTILDTEHRAIRGARGVPVFLGDGERFLYQPDGPGGLEVDLIDPKKARRVRLTDALTLRPALTKLGVDVEQAAVQGVSSDLKVVYFTAGDQIVAFERPSSTARLDPDRARWLALNRARIISDQLPTTFGDLVEAASPDGRRFVTQRDGDLWVRDASGAERRLTADAATDLTWGGTQESAPQFNVYWSPDGGRIAAVFLDNRNVPHEPLLHYLTPGATVQSWPYSRVGDPISRFSLFIIDPVDGRRVRIETGDTADRYVDVLGWSADGASLYYQVIDREQKAVEFRRADAASGASRTLAVERSATYIDTPFSLGPQLLTPLQRTDGFLLFSERQGGIRRLNLHDGSGRLVRPLGSDIGLVEKIVALDEEHGRIFVLAAGPNDRPYDTALYSLPLNGGPARRLTPGPGVREVWPSPDAGTFVVRTSDPVTPPVLEVRDASGRRLVEVSKADASGLHALGFSAPEIFSTPSSDGRFQVQGLILKPFGFDPARRYPVVEMIYGGMQVSHTPKSYYGFGDLALGYNSVPARVLLHQGFVVVFIDAPGTPGRGRAYQDATYGIWPQTVISNHAKWLRDAGAARPWMDLDRVGVFGSSWGGYMATRALVDAPDIYKVAVSMAGNADLVDHSTYSEPFMGLPQNNRDGYAAASIYPQISDIRGHILSIGLPLDVNAGFSPTMKFVNAMVAADKDVDMFVMPEINHQITCCGEHTANYGYALITRYFRRWLGQEAE